MHDLTEAEKVIADLYKPFTEKLLKNPNLRGVYLYGGRGMGKTSILKQLHNKLEESQSEASVSFLIGRDWEATRSELARLAEENESRSLILLLDDLDEFIRLVALFKDEVLEEVLLTFMKVAGQASQNGGLILSATLPQTRVVEVLSEQPLTRVRLKAFSLVLQRFKPEPLEPWSTDWQGRVGKLVERQLSGVPKGLQALCLKVVLDVTGGHPALLTSTLLEIKQLAGTSSRLGYWLQGAPNEDSGELETLLHRHLEDHLSRSGMVPLQRAISSLKAEAPEAYTALMSLAKEEYAALTLGVAKKRGFGPPTLKIRSRLLDEGLIYNDPETGRYVIPGDLLCQVLFQLAELDTREAAEQQPVLASPFLDPDPDFPEKRGYLVLPERGRRVLLSGGPWSILTLLHANPSRTFSLEELKVGPLNSLVAVRSAIQRLEGKLREVKAGKIVENVYGQGYRLVSGEWRTHLSSQS